MPAAGGPGRTGRAPRQCSTAIPAGTRRVLRAEAAVAVARVLQTLWRLSGLCEAPGRLQLILSLCKMEGMCTESVRQFQAERDKHHDRVLRRLAWQTLHTNAG